MWSSLTGRVFEMIPLITAVLGFIAGILADWIRQWTALWFLQRQIRKAIMAELSGAVVTLNFFILSAIENIGDQGIIASRYFQSPLRLESFEHYWGEQRDQLLKLPEWSRLKNWTMNLGEIGKQGHPPLFSAIMLFEALLIPPLSKCLERFSKWCRLDFRQGMASTGSPARRFQRAGVRAMP